MSRVSGMFRRNDLLKRYPEVKTAAGQHPEWLKANYSSNKIFFTRHATSLHRKHIRPPDIKTTAGAHRTRKLNI